MIPPAEIRPLLDDDLEAVGRLEASMLDPSWSIDAIRGTWYGRTLDDLMLGAWTDDELVGYAISALAGERVELYRLAVVPSLRRRGIARKLLQRVAAAAARGGAKGIDLEVRADNHSAREFYGILGFREVGRRPGYYRVSESGVDACLLSLELGNSPREPDPSPR